MVDPALMRGNGWVRCALCFERFEIPADKHKLQPVLGEPSKVWDVCRECAAKDGGNY